MRYITLATLALIMCGCSDPPNYWNERGFCVDSKGKIVGYIKETTMGTWRASALGEEYPDDYVTAKFAMKRVAASFPDGCPFREDGK